MSRNMEDQSLQPKGGKQRSHVLHLKAYSKSCVGKEGCQQGDNAAIENNNLTTLGRPEIWKQKSGKRSHWDPPIYQQFSANQDCTASFCKTYLSPIQNQLNPSEGQHTRSWTHSVVQLDKPFRWKLDQNSIDYTGHRELYRQQSAWVIN